MNIKLKHLTTGCGAVAAAVLLVAPGGSAGDTHSADAVQPMVTQGMVAVRDRDSGELRAPTADEALRYQSPVKRSDTPLVVERRADGSESMKLDDSYTIYSTVVRNEDGSWTRRCSIDHDHAQHAQKAVR